MESGLSLKDLWILWKMDWKRANTESGKPLQKPRGGSQRGQRMAVARERSKRIWDLSCVSGSGIKVRERNERWLCFYIWITQRIVLAFTQLGMTLCLANSTEHQVWHKKSTHHCMLFISACSVLLTAWAAYLGFPSSLSFPHSSSLLHDTPSHSLATAYAIPFALEYSGRTLHLSLISG